MRALRGTVWWPLVAVLCWSWAAWGDPARPEQTRVHIGFGAAISDEEVVRSVEQHPVAPAAVFMWASGLTGTHRAYEPMGVRDLVKAARASTIQSFEKGLKRTAARAQAFLDGHTAGEIAADESLQTQARSLLNLKSQLEGALAVARAGHPLVFGLEVTGDPASLARLVEEPLVRDVESAETVAEETRARRSVKPTTYDAEYRDPTVQTISPNTLHSALADFAATQER